MKIDSKLLTKISAFVIIHRKLTIYKYFQAVAAMNVCDLVLSVSLVTRSHDVKMVAYLRNITSLWKVRKLFT